jgi:uncharacterized protein YciI
MSGSRPIDVKLWLAVSRLVEPDVGALRDEHLEYLRGLDQRGVLFASGPIATDHGQPSLGGITVFRAADAEEAHRILADEPYVRAGVRTYELLAWSIRQGDLVAG